MRAGEVVGEGRVEEGGGVRGSEAPRRSTRGYQATVCVHIDTQSSSFCGDEADFALQTGVECRAAEAELVLVRLRWRSHEAEVFRFDQGYARARAGAGAHSHVPYTCDRSLKLRYKLFRSASTPRTVVTLTLPPATSLPFFSAPCEQRDKAQTSPNARAACR